MTIKIFTTSTFPKHSVCTFGIMLMLFYFNAFSNLLVFSPENFNLGKRRDHILHTLEWPKVLSSSMNSVDAQKLLSNLLPVIEFISVSSAPAST